MPRRISRLTPQVRGVGYIDMGIKSDLARARALFSAARRAVMYTPMDAANKTLPEIEANFERMAREYAPCDVVIADLEAATPDARVVELVKLCKKFPASNPPSGNASGKTP